jgi:putative ABC transport system substrate-binding protein
MNRRQLAAAAWAAPALVLPCAARAQQRRVRIGWLGNSRPDSGPEARAIFDAFVAELGRLGWIEGQSLEIERRFAEGDVGRFPALAAELARSNIDLIVATSGNAALAARSATTVTPIVFAAVPQPVGMGLVESLAHPGGRMTGLATLGKELVGKRFGLLHEAFPQRQSIALLTVPNMVESDAEASRAAAVLGLRLFVVPVGAAAEIDAAVAAHPTPEAWFVQDHLLFFAQRRRVVDAINRMQRPAIYPARVYVEAGGLMSYAPDLRDQFRRAAGIVDRVLRGARPADIPVEQPTRLELVLNLKAARDQALTLPSALLLRADDVIE